MTIVKVGQQKDALHIRVGGQQFNDAGPHNGQTMFDVGLSGNVPKVCHNIDRGQAEALIAALRKPFPAEQPEKPVKSKLSDEDQYLLTTLITAAVNATHGGLSQRIINALNERIEALVG